MAKRTLPITQDGKVLGYMIECPACGFGHAFWTNNPDKPNTRWQFNGDLEKPTFSPSMLIMNDGYHKRCHSFVEDGKIQFLRDCEHAMAHQTVDLPEMDGQ